MILLSHVSWGEIETNELTVIGLLLSGPHTFTGGVVVSEFLGMPR